MSDFIWLAALVITHIAAYYVGRNDGEALRPTEEAWKDIKRYEIDKHFEHMRYLAERKDKHEQ